MVMVVGPLALAMAAAALRRYPYGGARLSQWYGSLACLTIGVGVASLLAGIAKADVRRRVFQVAVGSLFVIALATLAKDMAKPYKRLVDFEHRGFVRWFWKELASEGEVVIGDSHEYGDRVDPFNKEEIDGLILTYLANFLKVPAMRIAERWFGSYAKHPTESFLVLQPKPGVTIVTAVGGAGMTLSFGLADKIVREFMGGELPTCQRDIGTL